MRKIAIILILMELLPLWQVQAQKIETGPYSASKLTDPLEIYALCKKISSPEFKGRLTGSRAYKNAADWAALKFGEWGLKKVKEFNGYLQPFPSPYTRIEGAEMELIFSDGKIEKLKFGDDFLPLLYSDSGDNAAELVFAGWGICAPELGYDDYAGIDVTNKFVLCFRGVPDRKNDAFQKYDEHRMRMQIAKQKGALGLIYIYPEPIANPNGDWISGFTPAIVGEKIANKILAEKNLTSKKLKEDLSIYQKPLSFALSSKIHFKVQSRHLSDAQGYNIVGYIEGTDSKLKNEVIVFGAHFDHCGEHAGLIFNGANDNASGSAVVMGMAHAASQLDNRPKRTIVFVLFGGEEKGLQGSTYFVEHLPSFINKVDLMLNFDMVGEGAGANCGYTNSELEKYLKRADENVGILRSSWQIKHVGVRSSDYAPFFEKGATCAAFFSDGPHLHYHKTGDTIYRINPDVMSDIAHLALEAALQWANR